MGRQFLEWMRDVTGIPLTDRINIMCSRYDYTGIVVVAVVVVVVVVVARMTDIVIVCWMTDAIYILSI